MTVLASPDLLNESSTALFALGSEYQVDGNRWKYVKAEGTVTQYACCLVDALMDAIEATTTLVGTAARPTQLVVPQIALTDEYYAWAPCGPFWKLKDGTTFKVLALNAATSVRLYTTANGGELDDAVTTGNVAGLALTETVTTLEGADCVAVQRLVSFCEL